MALLCGLDGVPISSLRGLFAWLMCKLGHLAEGFVERDPYGVATYGDASVLPPNAQCAIWTGLQKLLNPWFLTNDDDRGSFRDLANPNTAKIIHELLQTPATGVHLKVAVLEAIANSKESIGLDAIIRDMVLEKHDNTWLRSTALRAFAKSVQNDWATLESLDNNLALASDDPAAPEMRVDLLCLTRTFGSLGLRSLPIMEQAASVKKEGHTAGRFLPLTALPSDADLDVILDGASRVLMPESEICFERVHDSGDSRIQAIAVHLCMEFRIADTFTDSLARLTGDEQKTVKTTAFDLQVNPASPGLSFHKLDKAKDKNFWSVRVSSDIQLIVHKTQGSLLLCYVDHHDKAYDWAERRRLETHPKTGAAQWVEIRETVKEVVVLVYVRAELPAPQAAPVRRQARRRLYRAPAAVKEVGLPFTILDDHVETTSGHVSISTMHLAKGLEFRAVVVMACDDEIIPLQERIQTVGDDADLQEGYDTERQLLYVACTRARDHLLVTSAEPASEFLDDLRS